MSFKCTISLPIFQVENFVRKIIKIYNKNLKNYSFFSFMRNIAPPKIFAITAKPSFEFKQAQN